jgi:hypothetical protein
MTFDDKCDNIQKELKKYILNAKSMSVLLKKVMEKYLKFFKSLNRNSLKIY